MRNSQLTKSNLGSQPSFPDPPKSSATAKSADTDLLDIRQATLSHSPTVATVSLFGETLSTGSDDSGSTQPLFPEAGGVAGNSGNGPTQFGSTDGSELHGIRSVRTKVWIGSGFTMQGGEEHHL